MTATRLRVTVVLAALLAVGSILAQVVRNRAAVQLIGTWSAQTTVAWSWSVGTQQADGTADRSPWGAQTVADVGDVVVLSLKPVVGTSVANHTMGTVKVNGVVRGYCTAAGSAGTTCTVKVTAGMLAKNLGQHT